MNASPLLSSAMILLFATAGADLPLEQVAREWSEKLPGGGIVTAESIEGKVRHAAAGKLEPADLPAEQRIFEIGSISKVFTGLLLAIAVEEKRVRLDSTLAGLTGIVFADPKVGRITLLQLVTHTSGLPRLPDNLGPNPDALPDPYAEYDRTKLDSFLAGARIEQAPPFPIVYSNLGFGLLGDLLSRVYDQSWESLIEDKIARPLGLKSTRAALDETWKRRLAPPHSGAEAASSWTFQALAGAGALRSTSADLVAFGEALLDPGRTPIAAALKSVTATHTSSGSTRVGLGIFIGKLDGQTELTHGGGTGGYRSVLQILPESRTVRVVLINNDSFPAEALIGAVRSEEPGEAKEPVEIEAAGLQKFAGIFRIDAQARFTVIFRDRELWARLTGQPFIKLVPLGGDRFACKDVPAEFQFRRSDGVPDALVLHQNGREVPAARSDDPLPEIFFPTKEELAGYQGEFQLGPDLVITITCRADTLFAQLTGQPAFPVFMTGDDHFEYDVVTAALRFERDSEGKVIALALHQNGIHRAPRR